MAEEEELVDYEEEEEQAPADQTNGKVRGRRRRRRRAAGFYLGGPRPGPGAGRISLLSDAASRRVLPRGGLRHARVLRARGGGDRHN